jgi:hypothetical protein
LDDPANTPVQKMTGIDARLANKTETDIREITDKIMLKNNLLFPEKHFHEPKN